MTGVGITGNKLSGVVDILVRDFSGDALLVGESKGSQAVHDTVVAMRMTHPGSSSSPADANPPEANEVAQPQPTKVACVHTQDIIPSYLFTQSNFYLR